MSRSKLFIRLAPPARGAVFAFIAVATSSGCFVSFDGYELGEPNAGAGGSSSGGSSSGGSTAGPAGAPSGGRSGSQSSGGASAGANSQAGAGSHSAGSAGAGAASHAGLGGRSATGGSDNSSSGAPGAGAGGSAMAGAPAGGSSGGSSTLVCPDPHNRLTVEIPIAAGGFYCIDRAEVRNVEYQAFVDAASPPSGQSAACAFNTTYQPATGNGCRYDPINSKNQPCACVDWCDAAAFCKWDGKHLCGKVGGGTNPPASFADPSKSQWFRACSHAGDNELPYGNSYDGMRCIGVDNIAPVPVAVPSTNCEGGYSGLYDMSGNVAEWDDSCTADSDATDQCLTRGGSYLDTNRPVSGEPSLLCNSSEHGKAPLMATKARSARDKEVGFRCCSEPVPGP